MSSCVVKRIRGRVILFSFTLALVVGSPLYASQPADTAAAPLSGLGGGDGRLSPFIIPSLTFVGGVIVALVGNRLMQKRASTRETSRVALETKSQTKTEAKPAPAKQPPKPLRSEAITLLATLQREARFVDFIKEPLEGFSDAQIGAAARDVHRDCGKVLDRLFALRALESQEEGAAIDVPAGFDAGRFRLTGNVVGDPPFRGRLVHHGWEAGEVQLPAWSGTPHSARIIAPMEVELA